MKNDMHPFGGGARRNVSIKPGGLGNSMSSQSALNASIASGSHGGQGSPAQEPGTPGVVCLGWASVPLEVLPGLSGPLAALAVKIEEGTFVASEIPPTIFAEIYSLWRERYAEGTIAMTPHGGLSKALASSLEADKLPVFYDLSPGEGVLARSELSPEDCELVVISSSLHGNEIAQQLHLQGFPLHCLVDIACLCREALFTDRSRSQGQAIVEYVAANKKPGDRYAVAYEWRESRRTVHFLAQGAPEGLIEFYCDMSPHRETIIRYDPLWSTVPTGLATHIIVPGVAREAARFIVRAIGWRFGATAEVILPYAPKARLSRRELQDPSPAFVYAFPYAGTGRLMPTIYRFAQLLGRRMTDCDEPHCNPRALEGHWQLRRCVPDETLSLLLRAKALNLSYFEWFTLHQMYRIDALADLDWLKVLVLLRDPRDILTSLGWLGHNGLPFEEECLTAMRGTLLVVRPDMVLPWFPLDRLLDNFMVVLENDRHMRFIRFEDIHADPRSAYDLALRWLGWIREPYCTVTAREADQAIHLGSFKHQTQGLRPRGQDTTRFFGGTSCRKGTVGDWRNSWTDRMKDTFKELAGDRLIRLGYARDNDW
jgi:hypothetical protein